AVTRQVSLLSLTPGFIRHNYQATAEALISEFRISEDARRGFSRFLCAACSVTAIAGLSTAHCESCLFPITRSADWRAATPAAEQLPRVRQRRPFRSSARAVQPNDAPPHHLARTFDLQAGQPPSPI